MMGDFNTSEKTSLSNFWVRIFNAKNSIKNSKAAYLLAILLLFVRNVIK